MEVCIRSPPPTLPLRPNKEETSMLLLLYLFSLSRISATQQGRMTEIHCAKYQLACGDAAKTQKALSCILVLAVNMVTAAM